MRTLLVVKQAHTNKNIRNISKLSRPFSGKHKILSPKKFTDPTEIGFR